MRTLKPIVYSAILTIDRFKKKSKYHRYLVILGSVILPTALILNFFTGLLFTNNNSNVRRGGLQSARKNSVAADGAFIHVGRTGGSSLAQLLRNGCHSSQPHPCRDIPDETMISKLISKYYHLNDMPQLVDNNEHSFYIMTTRDPYERLTSAFVYEHFDNVVSRGGDAKMTYMKKYVRMITYRCFDTLEKFVSDIGDDYSNYYYPYPPNTVQSDDCTQLARAVVDAKVRPFDHWYYNYNKIYSWILPDDNGEKPKIYVIRYEHMWEDWKKINQLLGQKGEVIIPSELLDHRPDTIGFNQPVYNTLSRKGRMRLCYALTNEYKGYKQILKDSINLNDEDIHDSLTHSQEICPYLDDVLME